MSSWTSRLTAAPRNQEVGLLLEGRGISPWPSSACPNFLEPPPIGGERMYPGTLERLLNHFEDRKSTRLNSSHAHISYAVFCLDKKTVRPRRSECPERHWPCC